MPPSFRTGDFLLGLEGLAILRAWGTDPDTVRAQADEITTISGSLDKEPYNTATPVPSYEATEGYRIWAHTYDSMPNFLLPLKERAVHPLLDERPVGGALDAACGTGRHTRYLCERGHTVVGIDATEDMLAVAQEKVPAATFRVGRLEHLDLPDSSFDLSEPLPSRIQLPHCFQSSRPRDRSVRRSAVRRGRECRHGRLLFDPRGGHARGDDRRSKSTDVASRRVREKWDRRWGGFPCQLAQTEPETIDSDEANP